MSEVLTDVSAAPAPKVSHSDPTGLVQAFRRLDRLLERALAPTTASDVVPSFRGLYIDRNEVSNLLSREPGESRLNAGLADREKDDVSTWTPSSLTVLMQAFALSAFDVDLVVIGLAPEFDLRYEKLYSYLQDDVTRKRPTVELALNLLCATPEEKLSRRAHFSSYSPLIRHGLLHLVGDPNQVEPPFLAHYLKLDAQIARLLLGQSSLDSRLTGICDLVAPRSSWQQLRLSPEVKQVLPILASQALTSGRSMRLYFEGARSAEKREAVDAVAVGVNASVLAVDVDRVAEKSNAGVLWELIVREARIAGAVLYLEDIDTFRGDTAEQQRAQMLQAIADYPGITILAGRALWVPPATTNLAVTNVFFGVPEFEERCTSWQLELEKAGVVAEPNDVRALAGRFRLTPGQIALAVATAGLSAQWRNAQTNGAASCSDYSVPDLDELYRAARSQCGHDLAGLARKIETRYGWDDIVLPDDVSAQLHEMCCQAEYRHVVYGEWGFDRKLSLGKGLNVLFCGPPGTGKTMGAEVIAHELRLDLYRIDLSQIVSKYIGQTEKNLDRIFRAAENSNAILFFDEADALFGKRSEVRDSHDRYANIEISYLLQKMEEYLGISVLATNLRQNLDEAFVRRLQGIVEFPFPDEEYRRRIWENVFPRETPMGDDVRFDLLAREVRLAGGNTKNMALAAAFYAAADGGVVRMSHLLRAAHREHQKMGRSWNDSGITQASKVAVHANA